MEFQDLLDHQRKRYVDLVDAIVDGDCLPLVKYWGNNAPNVYAELSDLWGVNAETRSLFRGLANHANPLDCGICFGGLT